MLPWKEREDRPRMSDLITVVQVIGARVVKVDRLLDETHSQRGRVEIEIAVGPSRDCGHVMDPWHGFVSLSQRKQPVRSQRLCRSELPRIQSVDPGWLQPRQFGGATSGIRTQALASPVRSARSA